MATTTSGKITQVIGSTFDAEFPEDHLPNIYNALKVEHQEDGMRINLVGEVASHLGGGKIRAVALGSTDGLRRGLDCVDTGGPLTVPVGKETLGRVFNLLGDPVDNRGPVAATQRRPIHREPPPFVDLTPKAEVFETGIKVIDLTPDELSRAQYQEVAGKGGSLITVGPEASGPNAIYVPAFDLPEVYRILPAAMPVQMIAYQTAAALGLVAGEMRYLSWVVK